MSINVYPSPTVISNIRLQEILNQSISQTERMELIRKEMQRSNIHLSEMTENQISIDEIGEEI